MFQALAQMHRLDWKGMRDRVRRLINEHGSATLKQLADAFPPSAGIVELLGYLQIAQDDGHLISRDESEEITFCTGSAPGRKLKVTVPLTYFMPLEGQRNE
jgi:hypothetical protein